MKLFAFAFALLVVGTSAVPQPEDAEIVANEERVVVGNIRDIIDRIQQTIRERGLDPLHIESFNYMYNIPLLLNIHLFIDNLVFTGASDIQINELDYYIFLNRFRFDLELPRLALAVGYSGADVDVQGSKYRVVLWGRKSTQRVRLAGEARVTIGLLSEINIQSLDVWFSIGGISSDLTFAVNNRDLSSEANTLFNDIVPSLLKLYQNQINRVLSEVIRAAVEAIWG